MKNVFQPACRPVLTIHGSDDTFPVRRIYCVGRNYAEHAREMGTDPDREPPFFFSKPADALFEVTEPSEEEEPTRVPYPPKTRELHHEIELVIALGRASFEVPVDMANECVFGYAVGNDLTRRDLQSAAKAKSRPWDLAKGFDDSAVCGPLRLASDIGHPEKGRIWLQVNGELRQEGDLSQLIWSVPEVVADLSQYVRLMPGDLIYTGTPAGVASLERGDVVHSGIEGIGEQTFALA